MKQNIDKPLETLTIEELRLHIRESRKKVIRSLVLAVTTIVAFIFAGVAWFLNNTQVAETGAQFGVLDAGFDLATAGDDGGYYSSMLQTLGEKNGWSIGETVDSFIDTISGSMTKTTNRNQQIIWSMTADSNLQNRNDDTKTTTAIGSGLSGDDMRPGIYPGSSGTLTFYVVPKTSGTFTVNFQLSMDLYKEVAEDAANADDKTEVKLQHIDEAGNVLDTMDTVYISQVEDETAEKIISGHILFFETKDADGYYSDQITDGSFQETFEDAEAGMAYEVNIYWVWPYVLGQTLLPSQAYLGSDQQIFAPSNGSEHTEDSDNSDSRQEMFIDMCENLDKYFENVSTISKEMVEHVYANQYTSIEYALLNSAYNSADQYIGSNIRYFVLHLSASS